MVMYVVVSLLMMVVMLSGCAHRFTPEKVMQTIVSGKTTKQEILESFGAPDKRLKAPGMKIVSRTKAQVVHKPQEVWWYSPHQFKWLDAIEPEPLRIIFDEEGIVVRYDFVVDD